VDYPRNLREFDRVFAHKDACLRFLEQVRWGERGFACQSCGGREFWTLGTGLRRCKRCRFKNSVKTGTIFESSRLPLKMWFYAVWWITAQKSGVSALDLQRDVGLGSYRSAWLLLHKIRNAMTRADRTLLSGDVEIGELTVGANSVYVAAEFSGAKKIGRVRLARAAGSWEAFLAASVAKGAALHAPAGLSRSVPRASPLPFQSRVPLLGDHLGRWLKGTLHGRLEAKHLESYLEEFTFRFNHREAKSRGILFQRVMENAVRIEPAPYHSITSRKA
jgi:hypothetical protein